MFRSFWWVDPWLNWPRLVKTEFDRMIFSCVLDLWLIMFKKISVLQAQSGKEPKGPKPETEQTVANSIQRLVLGRSCWLQTHRSRHAKTALLDAAIAVGDGNAILTVRWWTWTEKLRGISQHTNLLKQCRNSVTCGLYHNRPYGLEQASLTLMILFYAACDNNGPKSKVWQVWICSWLYEYDL